MTEFLYKLWPHRRIILDVLCCICLFVLSKSDIVVEMWELVLNRPITEYFILCVILWAMPSIVSLWLVCIELKSFSSTIKSEWHNNKINFLYMSLLLIALIFSFAVLLDGKLWFGGVGIIVVSILILLFVFIRPYVLMRKADFTPIQCIGSLGEALLYSISFMIGCSMLVLLLDQVGHDWGRWELMDKDEMPGYIYTYIYANETYKMAFRCVLCLLLFFFSFYAIVIYFNTITSRIITKKNE